MKLEKLEKALRAELKRSPLKSAILGGMCLVAIYFWVPLIWKWLPGGESVEEPLPAAPTASATRDTATPETVASVPEVQANWKELNAWMRDDPQTASAQYPPQLRDPFVLHGWQPNAPAEDEGEQSLAVVAAEPPADVTPQQLGLTLGSTIVGPRLKVAMINGKSYREHAEIVVQPETEESDSQRVSPVVFKVAEVQPYRVVLERNEKQYALTIEKAAAGDEDLVIRRVGDGDR